MGIVEQYLLQLKNEKRRWRQAAAILTVLSLLVAIAVSWNLRMTGITMANSAACGMEEHLHSEECPVEMILVCGYSDSVDGEEITGSAETTEEEPEAVMPVTETPAVEETLPTHTHTETCYESAYQCGYTEHLHILSCYSDEAADLESAEDWEADIPALTGRWADDLIFVAQSQLGQSESEMNYIVAGDNLTKNGITRYGQWYGNPYGDWSSMFMVFCLNYADVPQDAVPWSPGVYNMMRLAQDVGIFVEPDGKEGQAGNLLFLDTDGNNNADKVAIVTSYAEGEVTAICGDWENTTAEIVLSDGDSSIAGYINIEDVQETYQSESLPGKSPITLDVEVDEELLRIFADVSRTGDDMYSWQWQYSADGNEPWYDLEGETELVCELENTEENYQRYYRLQGHKIEMRLMTLALDEEEDSTEEEDVDIITSEPIAPFNISKNNNSYTIDVYALPVDAAGNRISALATTNLGSCTVTYNKGTVTAESLFDESLGTYKSAYFGTAATASVNNVESVWVHQYYSYGTKYALAYRQTNGTTNNKWLTAANRNMTLYLRYTPEYTVTFESEGFDTLTETVAYNGYPTLAEPGTWNRNGYTLLGWTVNGNEQNVYTYDELVAFPITGNVTYTAKWEERYVTVSFELGEYAEALYEIDPVVMLYGQSIPTLPTPAWINNAVAMAFDGWYLNEEFTQEITSDYEFLEDTILYAKWSPKDDGYYVYFMDFEREGQPPLVLMTYSVTEGHTAFPYEPGNEPEGKAWDGKWYLEDSCATAYNFSIPVSDMTEYLVGANGRDLYLYPGTQAVCRAIFVTYGTRVDPITVPVGGTINLDQYIPEREGYTFAGWKLQDGTPVSGKQTLNETTTYIAVWEADYVPFEAILRIENANDTGMTQAEILGTWYAKAGSQIRVKSTYTGTGDNRKGTHSVVCVLDGTEYPVYKNSGLTQKAALDDVYSKYFIYNNSGTTWTDEVNWDDVYTGGELPYSVRPVSSAGDTIINFDYMRVRNDITFTIPNNSDTGGYIDVYKLRQNGLITGSVTYTGTKPTAAGMNVSATGVSATNVSWSYTATTQNGGNNLYTLHNMKYGQRIYEVYPVGGSWLTARKAAYHQYIVGSGARFSSRRQDLTSDFFEGSGRALKPYSLTAEFLDQEYIALMYAIECLEGETPDFTLNGTGYKVDTELCEVVKHTGYFAIKDLDGCEAGVNALGTYGGNNKYYSANISKNNNNASVMSSAKIGNTSVYTLFAETYWPYYSKFNGVQSVKTFAKAYIFYYDRIHMNIQFNFGYDSDGNGENDIIKYEEIAYGERISEYQFGMPDYKQHELLKRDGYEFAGWLDANGFVLEADDWESMVATGDSENNTMLFIAKWEKISNNIVEYYEDRSAAEPFETHYFDDGELMQYPTMTAHPQGWVWNMYGEGQFERYDWDVPMYGEYGVQEVREINGEQTVVNVIRIYGTWDESHTRVIYDPNAPQGGIPGTAPTDSNEYTIWQSSVPVASRGDTANVDPEMIFVGWQLDRNGVVYHPGDHVPVQWPRTMIFTAQWAKLQDVVYLRYDPNGGTPEDIYPNDKGFPYRKNATASVWTNTALDDTAWFTRVGYTFTGWNTEPDGSGTAYAPHSTIVLTQPVTTLYAQWQNDTYTMSLYKVDSDNNSALTGAEFTLYKCVNDVFQRVQSLSTGVDGRITFLDMETDVLYRLVEEKPPDGYAIIAKEIYFKVCPDGSTVSLVFCDSEGNVLDAPNGVTGGYITSSKFLTLTVKNLRGYILPSTGGGGLPLYLLCGLILVLAPLVYGLSLRRKYERRLQK